ncbi:MAG: DUF4301 family protein [Bacteroidales bacterium]|nr:DUF4301 family protein [Bacteroidales bacterium]
MFDVKDLDQFESLGISKEKIDWQLSVFRQGVPFIKLKRPATPGDGIITMSREEEEECLEGFERSADISKIKFVPASGAASRMFKALFEFTGGGTGMLNNVVKEFIDRLEDFAFYSELSDFLNAKGQPIEQLRKDGQFITIIKAVLEEDGLNYGNLPKGLLKFHDYGDLARTAFEEHLTEAGLYATSEGTKTSLHFTVSPEHLEGFKELLENVKRQYEKRFGIIYDVSFSIQKPSTDTMAVGSDNHAFRNPDGSILFRPGGHGALIHNLNELAAGLIFIKNIDNVVRENFVEPTVRYKKILAGKLIGVQTAVHAMLHELDKGDVKEGRLLEMMHFIRKELCYEPLGVPENDQGGISSGYIRSLLNRPIRVCGVVKNLGEPGGGPFWAPNSKGDTSLQIIESSQVDASDKAQKEIFSHATHFNPVDLVCGVIDYKGDKFELTSFVDPSTCFISEKSKDGKVLRALELPGLWNGAMADWITIFVEVPVETFNPVKTVNDLLRASHQDN